MIRSQLASSSEFTVAGNILLNRQLSRGIKVTNRSNSNSDSIDLHAVRFLHDIYLCPWYAFRKSSTCTYSVTNEDFQKAVAGGTSQPPDRRSS
jgi:hypothetical protein